MRVAVIGAGASGLTAIKCCLDEGLDVVCFERTDYISGLWHYTEEVVAGQACVMKSTVINTTKESMCYSDFPIPQEFAMYMHHKEVDRYFHMYADQFGLKKKIKFNTEVTSVQQSNNFLKTGRWILQIHDKKSGSTAREIYDAVLVCIGHHADKNMVSFPGMDKFQGSVIHAHDYKHGAGYEDRRVVVVGIGNSGGDIAVELSRISSQVYLSTRSGALIYHRIGEKGVPLSFVFGKRYMKTFGKWFPRYARKKKFDLLNKRFDQKSKSVVDVVENKVRLYKFMFPPTLERNTLGIIGCLQPVGVIMPMCEQQCRLATRVFKGEVTLPSQVAMETDIDAKLNTMARVYMTSPRHTIQVEFIDYMDELSELNGNKPNIFKMIFTDPSLAIECYFGPTTPYQFRLEGPGAWSGAREAILTQWDRTFYHLSSNTQVNTNDTRSRRGLKLLFGLCFVSLGSVMYWNYVRNTSRLVTLIDRVPR